MIEMQTYHYDAQPQDTIRLPQTILPTNKNSMLSNAVDFDL